MVLKAAFTVFSDIGFHGWASQANTRSNSPVILWICSSKAIACGDNGTRWMSPAIFAPGGKGYAVQRRASVGDLQMLGLRLKLLQSVNMRLGMAGLRFWEDWRFRGCTPLLQRIGVFGGWWGGWGVAVVGLALSRLYAAPTGGWGVWGMVGGLVVSRVDAAPTGELRKQKRPTLR